MATPYLHHTLILREYHPKVVRRGLNPLPVLDKLGLLPFVKKVQFKSDVFNKTWVKPQIFDSHSLRNFSALVGIQDLTIDDLDLSNFKGAENYFGHLSPTLRSVASNRPSSPLRQLLGFLRLFPKLDDIRIITCEASSKTGGKPDIPRWESLRGKLTLSNFLEKTVLEKMIAAFGRIRAASMNLTDVLETQLLLNACAETLQTLRLRLGGLLGFCKRFLKRIP